MFQRFTTMVKNKGLYHLQVEGEPNRYCIQELLPTGGVHDVSPYLTRKEFAEWVWAFEKGLYFLKDRRGRQDRKKRGL